jgi:hypothetical protein
MVYLASSYKQELVYTLRDNEPIFRHLTTMFSLYTYYIYAAYSINWVRTSPSGTEPEFRGRDTRC